MKAHFHTICNSVLGILFLYGLMTAIGCSPGWIVPSKVSVYTSRPNRQIKHTANLAILPLVSMETPPGPGHDAARLFEQSISAQNFFKKVSIADSPVWQKHLEHRDLNRQDALTLASAAEADLMLVGAVEHYRTGRMNAAQVTLNVMLVDVMTAETIWWGQSDITGKPGRVSFFLRTWFTPPPPTAAKLMKRAVKKIVSDIFSSAIVEVKSSAPPETSQPHAPAAEQPAAAEPGPGALEKDIFDSVIEEIDAADSPQ